MITTFRDIKSPADVPGWVAHLNARWPERAEIIRHIGQQVRQIPFPAPHVVELGSGPGQLAEFLLAGLPDIAYTGLDFSEPLLAYAQERVAPYNGRVRLLRADLNAVGWLAWLPAPVQAIISMQSLHDVGGEEQINRIYGLGRSYLAPGGLFLNADFIVPPGQYNPERPGRLAIAHHLALLADHGYQGASCTLEVGEFGCMVAYAPAG